MTASKHLRISSFERVGPSIAIVLISLMVLLQILRALAFSSSLKDPAQTIGCIGLGLGYLLIIPALRLGQIGLMAIMFLQLGVLGVAQLLLPSEAATLGGIALIAQCTLVAISLIQSTRKFI